MIDGGSVGEVDHGTPAFALPNLAPNILSMLKDFSS
jgi:hypothetical protein